jgi:hypothetical protein
MATTTPNYGWDVPTSTDYVKDGATAIETLGDDIDATLWTALGGAYPGLRLVKKQTIGSGVSSVNVTSAFSATYEAYKIIITGGVGSASNAILRLQLGASSSNYFEFLIYGGYAAAAVGGANNNGTAGFFQWAGGSDTNGIYLNVDLQNPFLAKYTRFGSSQSFNTSVETGTDSGIHKTATSYTDFTISPNTGTLTGGTIYVYGYGAS